MKDFISMVGLLVVLCVPGVAKAECFSVDFVKNPGPNFKIFLEQLGRLEDKTCRGPEYHGHPDYLIGFEFLAQGRFKVDVINFYYYFRDHGDRWAGHDDALERCYTLGAFHLPKGDAARKLADVVTEKLEEGKWKEAACPEYPGDGD